MSCAIPVRMLTWKVPLTLTLCQSARPEQVNLHGSHHLWRPDIEGRKCSTEQKTLTHTQKTLRKALTFARNSSSSTWTPSFSPCWDTSSPIISDDSSTRIGRMRSVICITKARQNLMTNETSWRIQSQDDISCKAGSVSSSESYLKKS